LDVGGCGDVEMEKVSFVNSTIGGLSVRGGKVNIVKGEFENNGPSDRVFLSF
jgi:hypothetical protein